MPKNPIRQVIIDGYPIDIAKIENHSFTSEVTSHPVEKGADVTDHIRNNPHEITLECVVSDTPIGVIAQHETRRVDDVTQAVFGEAIPLPSSDAYERLRALHEAQPKRLVTIETSLDRFDNMALTSLGIPRSSQTTGGLTFEVRFVQVVIVANRRVVVPVAAPRAKGKSQLGARTAQDYVINKRFLWNIGTPPGAPLQDRHAWCIVNIVDATPDALGFKEAYQFTGERSGQVAGLAARTLGSKAPPFPIVAGQQLGSALTYWFERDLARDQAEKLQKWRASEADRKARGFLTLDEHAQREQDKKLVDRGLPAGQDLSRFTAPRQQTFPTVGPHTTFAPGAVK